MVYGGVETVRALLGHGSGLYWGMAIMLLMVVCVVPALAIVWSSDRDRRRAVPSGVVLAVEETGLFLGEAPARRIPWKGIAELVVFRLPMSDAANEPALVIISRKSRIASTPVERRPYDLRQWGTVADLKRLFLHQAPRNARDRDLIRCQRRRLGLRGKAGENLCEALTESVEALLRE